MAKALVQSGRRVLPYLSYSCRRLDSSVELSHWPMKWEANSPSINYVRLFSAQANPAARAQQTGALKMALLSPGFVYEPYAPREKITFWRRWFTRPGWKRTKEDMILELKSYYAIAKFRKAGNTKRKFYQEAIDLYKRINTLMAIGDKKTLRKYTTENMYSALKNESKNREEIWKSIYWEFLSLVKIRTLRARLIAVDKKNMDKVFVQLTVDILSKQKFEAHDSSGAVVAGDKNKEILVRDIWVFEKSLFHEGAFWRLCGRIKL